MPSGNETPLSYFSGSIRLHALTVAKLCWSLMHSIQQWGLIIYAYISCESLVSISMQAEAHMHHPHV